MRLNECIYAQNAYLLISKIDKYRNRNDKICMHLIQTCACVCGWDGVVCLIKLQIWYKLHENRIYSRKHETPVVESTSESLKWRYVKNLEHDGWYDSMSH